MAFEPLKTDETRVGGTPPKRDMDTLMLIGCTGFVIASFGAYGLSVWPFIALGEIGRLSMLLTCLGIGFVPSTVFGILIVRRFGSAAACGHICGALTMGVFLYLRLQQIFISADLQQIPAPEYAPNLMWLLPLAWVLASAFFAIAAYTQDKD